MVSGHDIDIEYENALRSAFPWIKITGSGQAGPNFHVYMPEENKCLEDSEYFYSKEKDFFHITGLENVLSILNGQSIRLYNLESSKDKDEYIYGAKLLGLSDRDIFFGKNNVFTFSFCPFSKLKNRKIWDKYSKNFNKAAIVFSIENDISKWKKYHIGEVKYERPRNFETYKRNRNKINQKYGINFWIDLNPLIPFHKRKKFSFEEEVRLIGNFPFNNPINSYSYLKTDFRFKKRRNRVTKYIEFPLYIEPNSFAFEKKSDEYLITRQSFPVNAFEVIPKIKIKDVLIGKNCGITDLEYLQFRQNLLELFSFNYNYRPDLSLNLFSF